MTGECLQLVMEKVVDFNLMLKNGGKGKMESLWLKPGEEQEIMPEGKENFLAVYVKEGKAEAEDCFVEEGRILVLKKWEKALVIKKSGNRGSKDGNLQSSFCKRIYRDISKEDFMFRKKLKMVM